MGLSIKNDETERLVRELARRKGVGMTTAIRLAVSHELENTPPLPKKKDPEAIMAAVRKIQADIAKLPMLDDRTADEILGYDEFGLPT
jgi:antitoxin VapB